MSPKPPIPPKGPKGPNKCKECGHHHCICKSKEECSDCREKDCNCKQEINVVINFNFATGGTGAAGLMPDINFDFDAVKLTVNDQEINLRSGSKKDKKKDL